MRERDLVRETAEMSDQIVCNLEWVRKSSQCDEVLLLAERKTFQIGILKLWMDRKEVSLRQDIIIQVG